MRERLQLPSEVPFLLPHRQLKPTQSKQNLGQLLKVNVLFCGAAKAHTCIYVCMRVYVWVCVRARVEKAMLRQEKLRRSAEWRAPLLRPCPALPLQCRLHPDATAAADAYAEFPHHFCPHCPPSPAP